MWKNDNLLYARKNKTWVTIRDNPIDSDAPNDNKKYTRKNKSWIEINDFPFEDDSPQNGKTYGRKDGHWEEIINTTSPIGPVIGDHNTLTNIQGGKITGTSVTEAYHLTKEEHDKIPYRPSITSPVNNATNINQMPQIIGTTYTHPFDYPMYSLDILISKNNTFTDVIHHFNGYYNNTTYQVPKDILEVNTTYYVKIRYQDNRKKWSDYSDTIQFTTMIQFPTEILSTPILSLPTNGGLISDKDPLLVMSSPSMLFGSANFVSADWQIATDSDFNNIIYNATDSKDLYAHYTKDVNLRATSNSTFFVRARQKTSNGEYTKWSNVSECHLQPIYDKLIFGVRQIFNTEKECVEMFNLDENGNIIKLSKEYFDRHPLYQFNEVEFDPFNLKTDPDLYEYKDNYFRMLELRDRKSVV